jgi:hypothetical protein
MRLNHFNDFCKPYMAAGMYMWNGVAVVISPNVPQLHAADELVWIKPSLIWRFLWCLFGANSNAMLRFKAGKPIMEDQALWVGSAQKVFMSPAMWERVKNHAALINK